MSQRKSRSAVPQALTWNLEDLFTSPQQWADSLRAVEAAIPSVVAFKGRLAEGPAVTRQCLDAHEALEAQFTLVTTYAGLRMAQDGTDPANQAAYALVDALDAQISAQTTFIKSELLALPDGTVEGYMAADESLAGLRVYLERLIEAKPYMLSPQTEVALASLGEVHGAPYMIYDRAKTADMAFLPFQSGAGQTLENSLALYEDDYETDPDPVTRRNAFDSFTQGLKAYENTMAATFATEVKKQVVLARLRGYKSATEMLLQKHQVSLTARDNLLEIIGTELAPHMRRYARLRKRVLGLDQLRYCDLEAPLDPTYNPRISYDEACDTVLDALSVLGPEYSQIMRTALQERWVDMADNVGKASGAFCASPYGTHSYILMTWTDTMRGAFTLAHELGHAGHFQLTNRYQRLFNTEPSMFFVEAPSTMNELLLGQSILAKSTEPRMRRWVLMQFLATYHHNFVRHLLEGELQRQLYTKAEVGEPITAAVLSTTKGAILANFWGDELVIDEGARLTWMRQPHYYMGLYPYTYSAGLTTATAMAQLIAEEGEPAVARWLQVLKAGGTMRPLALASHAGVDMSSPAIISKAVAYVGSLVTELEQSFGDMI